jgi:hypothetical protein
LSSSFGTLEKVCHRLQDFPRKCLIRYGAGERHCSSEGAKSQDRSRSCGALVFAWQQPDNQLKIRLDLLRAQPIRDLLMVSIDINNLRGCGLAAQGRSDMEKGEAICVQ